MTIGIDKMGFATTHYVLKLQELAQARNIEPEKLSKGLLLNEISIAPITEDVVTLGAKAAAQFLTKEDRQAIEMVIVATESGIDQSKAAAVFIHGLLDIQPFARSIEMKEACYSATAALDYASLHIKRRPDSKVLVIASDIAKYGIGTPGEPTQGAGAVAMLITSQPRLLLFNEDNVAQTRDVMDFWRPNYATTPFVNGVYSTRQYLDSLKTTWSEYKKRNNLCLSDFAAVCFHLPYPKLALKGMNKLMEKDLPAEKQAQLQQNFNASILYSQKVGNIYTASLFLGLLSLLHHGKNLKVGEQIALFSYGSGAVSEIFSVRLVEGFEQHLPPSYTEALSSRTTLTIPEYEQVFFEEAILNEEGSVSFTGYEKQTFALTEIWEHQRKYSKVEAS